MAGRGIALQLNGRRALRRQAQHLRPDRTTAAVADRSRVRAPWRKLARGLVRYRLRLLGKEFQLHPAHEVVDDRLGDGQLWVAREAGGFEARVAALVDQYAQWYAILKL